VNSYEVERIREICSSGMLARLRLRLGALHSMKSGIIIGTHQRVDWLFQRSKYVIFTHSTHVALVIHIADLRHDVCRARCVSMVVRRKLTTVKDWQRV
jgi:hypothetical protein